MAGLGGYRKPRDPMGLVGWYLQVTEWLPADDRDLPRIQGRLMEQGIFTVLVVNEEGKRAAWRLIVEGDLKDRTGSELERGDPWVKWLFRSSRHIREAPTFPVIVSERTV